MRTKSTPNCQHIRTTGTRCGSPALHQRRLCFYHQAWRPGIVNLGKEENPLVIVVPVLEDAHAIQFALAQTMQRLLPQAIDTKTAGLMFYALQIASSNLKQMKELPPPEHVVTDLDAVHQPPIEAIEANDTNNDTNNDRVATNNPERTCQKPLLQPTYVPVEDARIESSIQTGNANKSVYNRCWKRE